MQIFIKTCIEKNINFEINKNTDNIKKNIDILLVGSSIIKRWNNIYQYYNKSIKIVNLGINGLLSKDMITKKYINTMSSYKPNNIIYYCGGNDIRSEINPLKNIKLFLLNLKNIYKNNINLIFISIFKNPKNILYNDNIDILNNSIKVFIDNYNNYYNNYNINLYFLDLKKYINHSKYFMNDNIHLNKDGYEILNKKIYNLIKNKII